MTQGLLKLVALFAMLIDHVCAVLEHTQLAYEHRHLLFFGRTIGRIALPIFVFFVVEGYLKTSNLKKYINRIFLVAIVSQIPFIYSFNYWETTLFGGKSIEISDFALVAVLILGYWAIICNRKFDRSIISVSIAYILVPIYPMISSAQTLNIFYELGTGVIILDLLKRTLTNGDCQCNSIFNKIVYLLTAYIAFVFVGSYANYHYSAMALIIVIYLVRKIKFAPSIAILLWGYAQYSMSMQMVIAVSISAILILLYNGKKVMALKKLYYYFYPIHLIILALVNHFIIF